MTLAQAIMALDSAAGENYWHVAKGKTRPDEPLYAAAVYAVKAPNDEPLAIAEGDDLAEVIHTVALKMEQPCVRK
jgi:hypothetical protein